MNTSRERGRVMRWGALVVVFLLVGCAARVPSSVSPQSQLLPCASTDCVRVLSWNVHGLPFQSSTPERLQRIAAKIEEQQPDLVLLQEVWFGPYKRVFRRTLKPDYDMAYAPGWVTHWPRGGLLVFLRRGSGWVAAGHTFVPYAAKAPWYRLSEGDGISGKGVLSVELHRGGQALTVADTHLQSQYPGHLYTYERRAQLQQLTQLLDRGYANAPMLIAGDFNTDSTEDLYTSDLVTLGRDLALEKRSHCQCGTHFEDDGRHRGWIDYVLARHFDVDAQVERITNEAADRPYSDHDGILTRLVFDGAQLQRLSQKAGETAMY